MRAIAAWQPAVRPIFQWTEPNSGNWAIFRRNLCAQEEICAMKSFIAPFVADQSGAVDFEDGLTVVSLIIGFICAIALMYSTVVQLYATVFGMLPG